MSQAIVPTRGWTSTLQVSRAHQVPDGNVDRAVAATIKMCDELANFCKSFNAYGDTLKELYSKYATDQSAVVQQRTCIINNTQLYLTVHMPASQRFMEELRQVMTNYTSLKFEDFEKDLSDIAETADNCAAEAELVCSLHAELANDIATVLNMERELAMLDLHLRELEARHAAVHAKHDQQQRKAAICKITACAVAALAVVGAVPSCGVSLGGLAPALALGLGGHLSDGDMDVAIAKMTAARQDIENAKLAAVAMAGPVKTCVQTLAAALTAATRLFFVVNAEIQAYACNTDGGTMPSKGLVDEDNRRFKLEQHYRLMKPAAHRLENLCMVFDAAVIKTRTMLARLVVADAQHVAYTKEWLETKLQANKLQLERSEGRKPHWELLLQQSLDVLLSSVTGGDGGHSSSGFSDGISGGISSLVPPRPRRQPS